MEQAAHNEVIDADSPETKEYEDFSKFYYYSVLYYAESDPAGEQAQWLQEKRMNHYDALKSDRFIGAAEDADQELKRFQKTEE